MEKTHTDRAFDFRFPKFRKWGSLELTEMSETGYSHTERRRVAADDVSVMCRAHVLHLHSPYHGLLRQQIPPYPLPLLLLLKKKKSKWPLYAHSGNIVADKESE